jgi:hypothetical protein
VTKSPIELYFSGHANYWCYWYLSIRVISKLFSPIMKEALAYDPAFLNLKSHQFLKLFSSFSPKCRLA